MAKKKPIKIAVLGIRSGTSAMTNLLDMAGIPAGDSSGLLNENNPNKEKYGYHENLGVLSVNESILSIYGGSWNVPPIFPSNWFNSIDERIKNLKKKAIEIKPMLIKDPRLCLTWAFWDSIYDLKPVLCMRNQKAVGQSLLNAQGINNGAQLWNAYIKSFYNLYGTQKKLVVVQFDELFNKNKVVDIVKEVFETYKLEHLYKPSAEKSIKKFIKLKMKHY